MAKVSLEKDKIKFLLVEGVHQKAVDSLRAAGYTNIEFHKGALDSEELKASIRDAHFIGLRSRTHLTEEIFAAAEKLVADFGLSRNPVFPLQYPKIVEYKSQNPIQTLYECSAILDDWRKRFAPKSAEEELHPCFVASLHYTDYIQYLIENRHFLTEHRKEVQQIAQRIRKYEIDHFQHPQNALAG